MAQMTMEDLRGLLSDRNPEERVRVTAYLNILRIAYNSEVPIGIWKSGRSKDLDMVISLKKGWITHSLKIKMTGKVEGIREMLDELESMED